VAKLTAERLLAALSENRRETGIVIHAVYQPVGGPGGKIMPPTYPNGPYLQEKRWIDGHPQETIVIDQAPSQANRAEEALRLARDAGRLELPIFELSLQTDVGSVRLTSLDFPHRYADAYLRDSEIDGERFDATEYGQAIRKATVDDVRPLYAREPYSLIYGAWDSHRKGRWPKFARLYTSMMYGLNPEIGDRRAGRMDPTNLTGAVDDATKAERDWKFVPDGEKAKGTKLSEIGHGHIAPNPAHGGVTVREIRRDAWISFAGLERLRFGDASPEAAQLARATLAALALVGDRLAFGRPSLWLRSGCDLTRQSEVVGLEREGGEIEPIEIDAAEAIALFTQLRDQTAAAGIVMETTVVPVTPTKQLADAIRFAVTQGAPAD
jgi:CRISPR-associated protein GSU0053/csb1, Dpsyc system